MRVLFPLIVSVLFSVLALHAQQSLPRSTQDLSAAVDSVAALTPDDFSRLVSQAQSGDPKSQYLLALAFEDGRSVPRDLAASDSWLLKSAEQAYVPAEAGMGETYLRGLSRENGAIPNYADADRWLRLAATQGNADAQFWLGNAYERGLLGTTDYREALKWLRRSADQGLPLAQYILGQMYEGGEGVSESDVLAATWYRKAADHFTDAGGVWEAVTEMVYLYRDGRLPKNGVEDYMWSAILDSCFSPPSDEDTERAARQISKAQINEAQLLARDWIQKHTQHRKDEPACDRDPVSTKITHRRTGTTASALQSER
jgi:TPR repeat protein